MLRSFRLLVPVALFAACGGVSPGDRPANDAGTGTADSGTTADAGVGWDAAAQRDADALCGWDDQCNGNADGMTQSDCRADVLADYADARANVSDEAVCIQCMTVRAEELEQSRNSSCQTPDTARIQTACGDMKQSCAGAP